MRRLWCLLCLLPIPAAAAPIIHYEGGITVASGDYSTSERTTSISWMTGLALERGRVTARASIPLWLQNSTLVSITGGGPVPSGDGQTVRDTTTTGPGGRHDLVTQESQDFLFALGDPVLQLSLRVVDRLESSMGTWLSVKVPTASAAAFGTGKWDMGGGVSLGQAVGTRWRAGLDVYYWLLGDTPTLEFENPLGSTASVSHFAGDWAITVSGAASTAVLPGYDPAVVVVAGVARPAGTGSWSTYLSFGLTESAAQFGVGFLWRVRVLAE